MQYKIPVQIENDDPILLGLSLKQLAILMVGFGLAYSIFNSLQKSVPVEVAAFPAILIALITLLIALFKQYEMTFVPFLLALLRFNINFKERLWNAGTDSHSPLDIGIVVITEDKKDGNVEIEDKAQKLHDLQDKLSKL